MWFPSKTQWAVIWITLFFSIFNRMKSFFVIVMPPIRFVLLFRYSCSGLAVTVPFDCDDLERRRKVMFTVTRQRQFPDGENVVEVSAGSFDYVNPDCLVAKYDGEGQEFTDPREAVETAIEIVRQWRKDSHSRVSIGVGSTLGMTLPFSPDTFAHARAWAKQTWESLEKCSGCGDPLPDSRKRWHANEWDGLEYCSEHCATRAAEFDEEQDEEFQSETIEEEN
jgi:hypothetical protein